MVGRISLMTAPDDQGRAGSIQTALSIHQREQSPDLFPLMTAQNQAEAIPFLKPL
jgi:hypothetical protein